MANDLVNVTYVLLTTAGMPYRIEDTDPTLAAVITPGGSNGQLTVSNRHRVNAASVESELTCLFLIDPAGDDGWRMPIENRIVNPYQGYSSSIKRWAYDRDLLVRREMFRWTYMWRVTRSPKIEGEFDWNGYSACERRTSPADLYLVMRLDGPRATGEYPIFSVWQMLQRAARASNPAHARFAGYCPASSYLALDHSPQPPAPSVFASSWIYNFPPQFEMLAYESAPTPPGAESYSGTHNSGNHYFRAFDFLTGLPADEATTEYGAIVDGLGGTVLWDDTAAILAEGHLPSDTGIIGLQTYGRNGGDGRPPNYLVCDGEPLFSCVPGAVFSSLESFNAVTMFCDVPSNQGKIVDFISMGGTSAIGHAFEPEVGATIQGEFLYPNLLRDADGDGVGDLSLVEAIYSALPYLSWSEVALGDPLMRLRIGPGEVVDLTPRVGDVNDNGVVDWADVVAVLAAYDSVVGDPVYRVQADVTQDGAIDGADLSAVAAHYGTIYAEP